MPARRELDVGAGPKVTLYRYRSPLETGKPPVLVVPDLMLGHAAYDLEGRGLPLWLQAGGREVLFLEGLLGPRGEERRSLAEAFAALRELGLRLSRWHGQVDLVGHGFGGTLALAALGAGEGSPLRRAVALSPVVDPSAGNQLLSDLLARGGRFSSLGLSPAGSAAFDLLFVRTGQLSAETRGKLLRRGLRDLGGGAAAGLQSWLESGDLDLGDGEGLLAKLGRYRAPTLVLLPLLDRLTPPEFGSPLRDVAKDSQVKVRVLSRAQLQSEDYTHLSVLQGKAAPLEIFPLVAAGLEAG